MSLQEKTEVTVLQKPKPSDFDPLTSRKLFAEELGINLSTLWRWEKEGRVPKPVRIGGRVGYPRSTVRKWKAEQGWPVQEGIEQAEGVSQ